MDRTTIFLQECGLSPLASKVLSLLLYSDGMTARRISETTNVAKQNLYPVLDNLEAKNLAVAIPTRPKIYHTDAEDALGTLVSEQEARITIIKKEQQMQMKIIKHAHKEATKELRA